METMSVIQRLPKINDCPYCGSDNVDVRNSWHNTGVKCLSCERWGPLGHDDDEVINEWNKIKRRY